MQQNDKQDIDKQEILSAINNLSIKTNQCFEEFAAKTDKHFEQLENDNRDILETINEFADNTERHFESLETNVAGLKTDMTSVKSTMVTKDYLDDKLADLRGDLVVLTRKEDQKVVALVEELLRTGILAKDAAKRILTMDPFPNTAYTLGIND